MSIAAKIAVENTPAMRLFVGTHDNALVEDNLGLARFCRVHKSLPRGIEPEDSGPLPCGVLGTDQGGSNL
jgi:hypothetical protein